LRVTVLVVDFLSNEEQDAAWRDAQVADFRRLAAGYLVN